MVACRHNGWTLSRYVPGPYLAMARVPTRAARPAPMRLPMPLRMHRPQGIAIGDSPLTSVDWKQFRTLTWRTAWVATRDLHHCRHAARAGGVTAVFPHLNSFCGPSHRLSARMRLSQRYQTVSPQPPFARPSGIHVKHRHSATFLWEATSCPASRPHDDMTHMSAFRDWLMQVPRPCMLHCCASSLAPQQRRHVCMSALVHASLSDSPPLLRTRPAPWLSTVLPSSSSFGSHSVPPAPSRERASQ